MTVFPYGRSGMIAGAITGLGRALARPWRCPSSLRASAKAGSWSLFDGGCHSRPKSPLSAAAEFSSKLPTGAYIAAGFVPVRPRSSSMRWLGRQPEEGSAEMTSPLNALVKGPTFHPISASRKIKNKLAAILFAPGFPDRHIPLVWVPLSTVLERGFKAVISAGWWEPVTVRRATTSSRGSTMLSTAPSSRQPSLPRRCSPPRDIWLPCLSVVVRHWKARESHGGGCRHRRSLYRRGIFRLRCGSLLSVYLITFTQCRQLWCCFEWPFGRKRRDAPNWCPTRLREASTTPSGAEVENHRAGRRTHGIAGMISRILLALAR